MGPPTSANTNPTVAGLHISPLQALQKVSTTGWVFLSQPNLTPGVPSLTPLFQDQLLASRSLFRP